MRGTMVMLAAASMAATAAVGCPARTFAQSSRAEMNAFPMPPRNGYAYTYDFGARYNGYFIVPGSATPNEETPDTDYQYVRFTGVAGRAFTVYGAWGTTSVPHPAGRGDNCSHAHASYGVWVRRLHPLLPWLGPWPFWTFHGGGGMSGERLSSGHCVFRPRNPLASIDERFGWGDTAVLFDFRRDFLVLEVVVGALSNTHGWGTCRLPPGSFPACREPSWIIGYLWP